jgi:DNA end-binding protein Ku
MRSIWKGSITFGLVNVPVALYPATHREELSFRLLRSSDLSPINYKRIAEADGKEVPWAEIVKGYEYEKGKFVVLKEDDFRRVDIEATQTIDIVDFVNLKDVNPIYFNKPYYLEPQKGSARVYHLLREVLNQTGRIGIATVVIKTRQHLASVKPNNDLLVLEVMHFADELINPDELSVPAPTKVARRELEMAETLVDRMSIKWDPQRYTDEYKSALLEMIEKKIESGGREIPTAKPAARGGKVIDLMTALRESLDQAQETSGRRTKRAPKSTPRSSRSRARKKAA